MNIDLGDYEPTYHNLRALMHHEVYGHGIMGYTAGSDHYKAYLASMDYKGWDKTTYRYQYHDVQQCYPDYYKYTGSQTLPNNTAHKFLFENYDKINWK